MRNSSRGWALFSLVGIGLWIGVTVMAGVLSDDPTDAEPTTRAFAAGGAVFFTVVFVAGWRASSRRRDPELDLLLAELALEPGEINFSAGAIESSRRIGRAYIVLGALVTALGLAAIWVGGEGGEVRVFLYPLGAIVAIWAAATPMIVKSAFANSAAVLEPLGLALNRRAGPAMAGERHARAVRVYLDARGSRVELDVPAPGLAMNEAEVAALAGRGDEQTWKGVSAEGDEAELRVSREGHDGPAWLWDLWLAETLAAGRG